MGELAPDQLALEGVDVVRSRSLCSLGTGLLQREPDLRWPDLTEVQVRRQPRGAFLCREVAALGVVSCGPIDEGPQTVSGGGLAGLPGRRQTLL